MHNYLDFEKPIAELESKVADLQALSSGKDSVSIGEEIDKLQQKAEQALADTYAKLTPWQKTQVARHPDRPHCMAFVNELFEDFTPLAGDRYFSEDHAIVGRTEFGSVGIVVIGVPIAGSVAGDRKFRHPLKRQNPDFWVQVIERSDEGFCARIDHRVDPFE